MIVPPIFPNELLIIPFYSRISFFETVWLMLFVSFFFISFTHEHCFKNDEVFPCPKKKKLSILIYSYFFMIIDIMKTPQIQMMKW